MFGLKKGKKRKRIKNIELSWHEGKFFDYWFFVHALNGMVFGIVAHLLNLNFEGAIIITIVIMIGFEISENIFGNTISEIEHPVNSLIDILEGVLIFYLTFKYTEGLEVTTLFWLAVFLLAFIYYLRKSAHKFIKKKRWWRMKKK